MPVAGSEDKCRFLANDEIFSPMSRPTSTSARLTSKRGLDGRPRSSSTTAALVEGSTCRAYPGDKGPDLWIDVGFRTANEPIARSWPAQTGESRDQVFAKPGPAIDQRINRQCNADVLLRRLERCGRTVEPQVAAFIALRNW